MDYVLKIMSIEEDSKDTRRFIVVRPNGFVFEPGSAAYISINKPGQEDNKRLCPFFSLNNDFYIELVFKEESNLDNRPFYDARPGEELILSDVVGNLKYSDKGVFIAAGKGIIAMIDIFKHLKKYEAMTGNNMICFARGQDEVPYERMLRITFAGNNTLVLGKDPVNGNEVKKADEALITQKAGSLQQNFYVAGPKYFVENMTKLLDGMGVKSQSTIMD
jgi:ferredoxin-NADP reductase